MPLLSEEWLYILVNAPIKNRKIVSKTVEAKALMRRPILSEKYVPAKAQRRHQALRIMFYDFTLVIINIIVG